MRPADDVYVKTVEQHYPQLGRQVVHDPQSRGFALTVKVDRSTWHNKRVRLYDPIPNPNQKIGNCTGCAKAMQFNAQTNRISGRVFNMKDADRFYSRATSLDPWPGSWEPDDTGSSGLGSAKAAQQLGDGGEYRWLFGGVDHVVQAIMEDTVVSNGTWWYESMFDIDPYGRIEVAGDRAGGHQWIARGYDVDTDEVIGRCWWGTFRDFKIKRTVLGDLLADDGDSHVQKVLLAA